MVDERLSAMLGEPIMMVVAVAESGSPRIARGVGARRLDPHLDVFVSRTQWASTLDAVHLGGWLALTLCRPATYETYQVKGMVSAVARADSEDQAYAEAYMRRTFAHLAELGVGPRQMSAWLSPADLVRIRFKPEMAFAQTPGPGAGRPMPEAVR